MIVSRKSTAIPNPANSPRPLTTGRGTAASEKKPRAVVSEVVRSAGPVHWRVSTSLTFSLRDSPSSVLSAPSTLHVSVKT